MKLEMDCIGGSCMNQIFLASTQVGMTKEELIKLLEKTMDNNGIKYDKNVLFQIYEVACNAYKGKKRYSGEEYVTHTINVALLLAELCAEQEVIYAGLFCDVFSKGDSDKIQNNLHSGVWNVVKQLENEQNTNEVILIKLAERLHNMRTIEYIDESKRTEKIKETMEIYMPLARKINNQKLMDELNNLVFS